MMTTAPPRRLSQPDAVRLFAAWLAAALPEDELARLRQQARRTIVLMPAGMPELRAALEILLELTEET
jgi:hypothetical protein